MKLDAQTRANIEKHTKSVEAGICVILGFAAFFIVISNSVRISTFIQNGKNFDKSLFWSFQCYAAVFTLANMYQIGTFSVVIIIFTTPFLFIALYFVLRDKYNTSRNYDVTHLCEMSKDALVTTNTFAFIFSIVFSLPWLILGFYLYTLTVIVRVTFLIDASLGLILSLSNTVYYFNYNKLCTDRYRGIKLITNVLVLFVLVYTLYILYNIVFKFTPDNISFYQGLLSTIVTLTVSLIVFFYRREHTLQSFLAIFAKKESRHQSSQTINLTELEESQPLHPANYGSI